MILLMIEAEIGKLASWTAKAGLEGRSEIALLEGFAVRAAAAGLPLMRAIVNTAPQSVREASSDEWKHGRGECAAMLREAERA